MDATDQVCRTNLIVCEAWVTYPISGYNSHIRKERIGLSLMVMLEVGETVASPE